MTGTQAERAVEALEAIGTALVLQTNYMKELLELHQWRKAQDQQWLDRRVMLAVEKAHADALLINRGVPTLREVGK